MKNYKVEATMKFTDKEENTKRVPYNINLTEEENEKKGSVFYCTKERYEFLKRNNAVRLVEVLEVEKVEYCTLAENEPKEIETIVTNEIVEENKEEEKSKPKKKKSRKK